MSLDLWIYAAVKCEICKHPNPGDRIVFDRNVTHNLVRMWDKAGVYEALYLSDGKRCGDYLPVLEKGLDNIQRRFSEYEELNPPNGWGSAQGALEFLTGVVIAVRENPDGMFRVSR